MTAVVTTGFPQNIEQVGEPTIPTITGMTAKSSGAGAFRTIELTFDAVAIALVDEAGVVAYKGTKVLDFAEGALTMLGAVAALTVKKSSAGVIDAFDGDFSVGTVTASNNATLATTEQNIIPTTATPQATGAGAAAVTTAKGVLTTPAAFDGTGTPVDVYLNFLIDDTDHDVTTTPANLIVSGTLTLHYLWQGNH